MSDRLLEIADELYALPLADFTAARDALVREHKADKELATQVKALKKASVAAWVVNLFVRRDPEQVDQVLEVGAALREAAAALDAGQLRELTKQRRQLTSAVTTSARRAARLEGVNVTPSVADQVESTLTAAMIDADAARAVRSGLLVSALQATGVDEVDVAAHVAVPEALGFSATPRPVGEPDPSQPPQLHVVPDPDRKAKEIKAADQRLAEAQEAHDAAVSQHEEAVAEVEELRARTLQLQSEIDELQARIAALEEQVDETDEALAEAEEAATEAQESVRETRSELASARSARERLD